MKATERAANRQQWRTKVEAWRTSGQRLSIWAREQGISRDALEYWKQQFTAEASASVRERSAPAPISLDTNLVLNRV